MAWVAGVMLLVFPLLEFWLLVKVQPSLTLAVVQGCITGGIGWWFARREGLDLWTDLESDFANNRVPTEEGVDAILVMLGGWALIVPGLLTDLLGGVVLVPAVRRRCIAPLRRWMRKYLIRGH